MISHRVPILKPDQSYTFGSYFKMRFPVAEILQELGVTFEVPPIEFKKHFLYGAITTGDIWQFGSFARAEKRITQDTMLYWLPTDLAQLMQILVGILQAE